MDENTAEHKEVRRIGGPKKPKGHPRTRIMRLYRRQSGRTFALQLVLDHAAKEQVGRATAFRDWKAVQALNREDFDRERDEMASRIFSMRSRLFNSAVKRGQMQTAANVLDSWRVWSVATSPKKVAHCQKSTLRSKNPSKTALWRQKLDISLRPAQGEVFSAKNRFRVLVAGRRFGKSYLSCIELFTKALERPGETFFYCAPTYRMAKDIAWKTLKKIIPKEYIRAKNETDLRLDLVNDSTIELKGTENAMALRGRSLAGVVLDEAAFMESEVWFEVIRPALADKQGWALFISTPMEPPVGFTTSGVFAKKTKPAIGFAGVTQRSKGATFQHMKSKQPALSLIRARSARNLKRRSRTSPDLVAISFSDDNISPDAKDISDPSVAARR